MNAHTVQQAHMQNTPNTSRKNRKTSDADLLRLESQIMSVLNGNQIEEKVIRPKPNVINFLKTELKKDISFVYKINTRDGSTVMITSKLITDTDPTTFNELSDGLSHTDKNNYLSGRVLNFQSKLEIKKPMTFLEQLEMKFKDNSFNQTEVDLVGNAFVYSSELEAPIACRNSNGVINVDDELCSISEDFLRLSTKAHFKQKLLSLISDADMGLELDEQDLIFENQLITVL